MGRHRSICMNTPREQTDNPREGKCRGRVTMPFPAPAVHAGVAYETTGAADQIHIQSFVKLTHSPRAPAVQ